ncbi:MULTISPECIES: 50S ribosomal protein L25 [Mesotoga]|uniref:50S ribosomal protein L25 n=1 Tax=Mesotoga TaxID=1184396 RepID=UPI0002CC13BC|nr:MULTISPECIES: 50S ribosomal protein L25 [Mesotoga]MCP5456687.1 50S ribosomal protein L25 [Thermotogota bacterium]CCU86225.1 50S ribosomal protein L25 [Mesotoga infera]MCP5460611.1 50S ribosomal protein L25 [Thermotogota bacterium]MDK2945050.1 large subunit ribosomal protein [Mesotoga sp.]HNQ70555.1 50S ribosomal protein L25 [Mesotoga prima]
MHEINLVAELRNGEMKAKSLLNQGKIPAVVYGPELETVPVSLDKVEILRIMNRIAETTSVVISIDGKEYHTFLKGVQRDKVTDSVIHLDFYVPSSGHKMELRIPIRLKGTPIGVEKGGIVDHIINELPVSVLPKDIVEEIIVDVSSFDVGHVLRVGDLEIPEGIKPLLDDEDAIMLIALPRAVKEVEEEEAEEIEEGVEPEVINKGKKEEEEEE